MDSPQRVELISKRLNEVMVTLNMHCTLQICTTVTCGLLHNSSEVVIVTYVCIDAFPLKVSRSCDVFATSSPPVPTALSQNPPKPALLFCTLAKYCSLQ
jgi:hypothetical protein